MILHLVYLFSELWTQSSHFIANQSTQSLVQKSACRFCTGFKLLTHIHCTNRKLLGSNLLEHFPHRLPLQVHYYTCGFLFYRREKVHIFVQSIPQMLLIKLKLYLTRKNDKAHYLSPYIIPPLSRLSRLVKACWGVQAFCQAVTVFIREEFMLLEAPSVLCSSCLCESVPLLPEHYPESEFLL